MKIKKWSKRSLAFLLMLSILISIVPAAFATAGGTETSSENGQAYVWNEAEATKTEDIIVFTEEDYILTDALWEQIRAKETELSMRETRGTQKVQAIAALVTASENYVEDSLVYHEDCFTWKTTEGIACLYSYETKDESRGESVGDPIVPPESDYEYISYANKDTPTGVDVYLIGPFYGVESDFTDHYKGVAQKLASTTGGTYTLYSNTQATITNVAKAISNGSIVLVDSHGTTNTISGVTRSYLRLTSGTGLTDADYDNGSAYYSDSKYMVTGDCISAHMTKDAPNSFVWYGICSGMAYNTMSKPVMDRGVAACLGYSQTVSFAYDRNWLTSFTDDLMAGETVATAAATMKSEVGKWDRHTTYTTLSSAISNGKAFPIVVSAEDSYPSDPDNLQTVKSTWRLYCEHASATYVAAKEPTCTEAGNIAHYYCSNCLLYAGDADFVNRLSASSVSVAALGHDLEGCVCTVCGIGQHTLPDSITTVVRAATCKAPGIGIKICMVCGESVNAGIATAAHTYSGNVCTVCGHVKGGELHHFIAGTESADFTFTVHNGKDGSGNDDDDGNINTNNHGTFWSKVKTTGSDYYFTLDAAHELGYKVQSGDIIEIRMKNSVAVTDIFELRYTKKAGQSQFSSTDAAACRILTKSSVAWTAGTYRTVQFTPTAGETIYRLLLDPLYTDSKTKANMEITMDYIYIGPPNGAPSKTQVIKAPIYFDFTNDVSAQSRFATSTYRYQQTIESSLTHWQVSSAHNGKSFASDNLVLTPHTNGNPYARLADSTGSGTYSDFPLNYTIRQGDYVQLAVKFENCTVMDTDSSAELILDYFTDESNASEGATTVYNYGVTAEIKNEYLTDGQYHIYTIPLNMELTAGEVLTALRPRFNNVNSIDPTGSGNGKVSIDYIAIGQLSELPVSDVYTVTFVNDDGTTADTKFVARGEEVYTTVQATKAPDAQYHYTHAGWDADISSVTEDMTVSARYSSVAHTMNEAGVCAVCGKGNTLLHFRYGDDELMWQWDPSRANSLAMQNIRTYGSINYTTDTTTSGGGGAAYVAAWPKNNTDHWTADADGNPAAGMVDHSVASGDVVEVRFKVTYVSGTKTDSTVRPMLRFHVAGGASFDAEIYGDTSYTVDEANGQWITAQIPLDGTIYEGDTLVGVLFSGVNAASDSNLVCNVELDYIYIGQPSKAPVLITYKNNDGSVLQSEAVGYGTTAPYREIEPVAVNADPDIEYRFAGWTDESNVAVNPDTRIWTADEVVSASYLVIDKSALGSTKTLSKGSEENNYTITLDAFTYGNTFNTDLSMPQNITIVMDRSGSLAEPRDKSTVKTFADGTTNATLQAYMDSLDPTHSKQDGYFVVSNWLGWDYYNNSDNSVTSDYFISWEEIRYIDGEWKVWQTISKTDAKAKYESNTSYYNNLDIGSYWGLLQPFSTYYKLSGLTYHNSTLGKWVSLGTACTQFYDRVAQNYSEGFYVPTNAQNTVKFTIGVSRRGEMQENLWEALHTLYAENDKLPSGQYHHISIVPFGDATYIKGQTTDGCSVTTDMGLHCTNIALDGSTASVNALRSCIMNSFVYGSTRTDAAMTYANKSGGPMDTMKTANPDATNTLILLTDGVPSSGTAFDTTIANTAISQANSMHGKGVTVYSIGFMDGLNSTTALYSSPSTDLQRAHNFMYLVSSNYPDATSMTSSGLKVSSDKFYSAPNGSALAEALLNSFTTSATNYTPTLGGNIVLRDVVKREFKINGITVEKQNYLGAGTFAASEILPSTAYTVSQEEVANTNGDVAVTINWTDAPNAYLTEDDRDGTRGYRIVAKINIAVDYTKTIGGNNIPTNGSGSGAYYPSYENPVAKVEYTDVPNVNVPIVFDYNIHDYYMDLYHDGSDDTSKYLFFDFTNGTADQTRYNQSIYGNTNFDKSNWKALGQYSLTYVGGIGTAKISKNSTTTNNDQAYIQSASQLLNYTVPENAVVKMRVSFTNCTAGTNPLIYFGFYEKGADETVNANFKSVKHSISALPNGYAIYTFSAAELAGKTIGTIRPGFQNIIFSNDTAAPGTVEIDYIYIGTEEAWESRSFSHNDIDLITAAQNAESGAYQTNNAAVFPNMYSYSANLDGLYNKYVSIGFVNATTGSNTVFAKSLTRGKADAAANWSVDTGVSNRAFDFTADMQDMIVNCVLTPNAGTTDSLGQAALTAKTITKNPNYYAPKFVIVDYQTSVTVDLGAEAATGYWPHTRGDAVCTLDNNAGTGSLTYTFRNGAADGVKSSLILSGIERIPYALVTENEPLGSGTKKVDRTFSILPANVVEYDVAVFSAYNYNGVADYADDWTEAGNVRTDKQNSDNTDIHGYDSDLSSKWGAVGNSFNNAMRTTVSANVRDENGTITEYHNNKAISFTFTGTGFDIITQTGPTTGVYIAEVYAVTNGAVGSTVVRRFLVDTYVDYDLRQIPTVHCTDLDYGTYFVVIRGYYSDIFNHNYQPATKSAAVLTEQRIRQELGLSEDDILEYYISQSTAAPAKRAATATSYDVVVDGIRIYNTLGTLTAAANPEAYYAYGLAGEVNPTFVNAKENLLNSAAWGDWTQFTDGTNMGMAYIAGGASSDLGTQTTGIHLSMSGALNTVLNENNGKYYLVDAAGEYILAEKYGNATIYCEADAEGKMHYYCIDPSTSEPVEVYPEVAYYSSLYDVEGPENEIYLEKNSGVAFDVSASRVLISAKSPYGTEVELQAWNGSAWVSLMSGTNRMEMYYDVTDYVVSGSIILRNAGEGILSLCNMKLIGAASKSVTISPETLYRAVTLICDDSVEQESTDASLKFKRASLTLQSDFAINFYVLDSVLEGWSDPYVVFTKAVYDKEGSIVGYETETVDLYTLKTTEDGFNSHVFTFSGLNATEMGSAVTATLYATKNGTVYQGATVNYSVLTYAKNMLAKSSDAEFRTMLVDLLNYGAAAQIYFGYNTANLANASLTEEQKALATQTTPSLESHKVLTKNEGATVSFKTCTLLLEEKVSLNFYLNLSSYTGDVSDLEARVTYVSSTGATVEKTIDSADFDYRLYNGSYYYVAKVDCLNALQMRTVCTVEVFSKASGERISHTVTYSVESFAYSKAADADVGLVALTTTLMKYGDSAERYFVAN